MTLDLVRRVALSPRLYIPVRLGLAVLFIYAGAVKLADPRAFARTISHYGLVPEPLLPTVAVGLPVMRAARRYCAVVKSGARPARRIRPSFALCRRPRLRLLHQYGYRLRLLRTAGAGGAQRPRLCFLSRPRASRNGRVSSLVAHCAQQTRFKITD